MCISEAEYMALSTINVAQRLFRRVTQHATFFMIKEKSGGKLLQTLIELSVSNSSNFNRSLYFESLSDMKKPYIYKK